MDMSIIENDLPYIGEFKDRIDNSIIEIELADSIKDDINYCDILLGFTY